MGRGEQIRKISVMVFSYNVERQRECVLSDSTSRRRTGREKGPWFGYRSKGTVSLRETRNILLFWKALGEMLFP